MIRRTLLGFFVSFLMTNFPGPAVATPLIDQQYAQGLDDLARELRDWIGRWGDYLGSGGLKNEDRPLISIMLRNRDRLDLSAAQVKSLEQLQNDFQKESIRKDADLRVAQMDLKSLLEAQKVDMPKAEAKVREIERHRADLRIARIRVIEKAKDQLNAEQRKKLQELLTEPQFSGVRP